MMSDNSSENSSANSADLSFKYSRLAAEYSKLRAQNTVLKKAVLDEQAKNNELNETVRSRNQMIRKTDQEMEALKFRNSQLSVRITVLQEELDLQNNKSNKKKSKHSENSNGIVGNVFLDTEIEKTMMEHAKLISELSRKDEIHGEEVKALKNEISTLNYELERKNSKLKQILEDHQMESEQLKREQQDLKREYASKVVKLKETEVELSTLKNVHKTYVEENGPKLEALTQLLPRKIPFADEENELLNRLNARFSTPFCDKESHLKQLHKLLAFLLLNFYNVVHNVTLELQELGLEELRMYIKSLLKDDDGVQLYEKLIACYLLLDNIGLQSHSDSMQNVIHEFIESFLDFMVSVHSSYLNKYPSNRNGSSNDYRKVDVPVKAALEIFQIKKNELVAKVITLPNSQHSIIHDEFEHFNEAIQSLVAVIDLIEETRQKSNGSKIEKNVEFRRSAISYLRSLRREPVEHVPYEEALENKMKLQESEILINSLKQEIKSLENTITSLEQEKITVQEEYRIQEDTNTRNETSVSNSFHEKKNELGRFISACELPAEILAREKEILLHMNNKLCAMVVEKQDALSKARNYVLECKALRRRLEYCATEKQLLEQKYLKTCESSVELKEELSTVSQNYESHLSVMSEHLANVNEKLAVQSEEIDKLHYQLNNKVSKKNKPK